MPPQTPCPVPDIDRALSSFVNSREETLKIRRSLSKYLTASLRPVNTATQNQHLNHEYPHNLAAIPANPPGLKSARVEYLEALRGLNAAQARHRNLRALLDELQNRHNVESPSGVETQLDNEVARSYVALVQQRRRFSELQVIQESIEKLLNTGPATGLQEPKTVVKEALGEQPDLPAERLDKLSDAQDDDLMIMKLKKEVLEARSSMDRAASARTHAQSASQGVASLESQVYALTCAREEIVEWVQEELAKMEEESEFLEDASPVKRPVGETNVQDLPPSESNIRGFYDRYTASRSTVIDSYDVIQRPPKMNEAKADRSNSHSDPHIQDQSRKDMTGIIAKILPHLPHLSRSDISERALLQQAVYLQTQISSADEEMTESLARMSGESHLLPSREPKGIETWKKTAAETETLNENFVEGLLQDSHREVNNITTIVELCSLHSKVLSSS